MLNEILRKQQNQRVDEERAFKGLTILSSGIAGHSIGVDVHSKFLARIVARKITDFAAIKSKNARIRRSSVMKRMICCV